MNIRKELTIRLVFVFCIATLLTLNVTAQEKAQKKIMEATSTLSDFSNLKESIPSELLAITQGIVIVPKLINAGFVVGGKRGRGLVMVKEKDGRWSNPVFVTLTGGSFGAQIGVQSVDLILVFKHRNSLTDINKNTFTLGGDLSLAAGPIGRNSTANTDYKLDAEVYSYSRSRGIFAGISLNGASLNIDAAANKEFYGQALTPKQIFHSPDNADEKVQQLKDTLGAMK